MEFRILGPLEVADGGGTIRLHASKQRALLGVLLLHANEVVSSERLIDELWGERPPATAAKLVQTYVSQLRRALGPGPIATRPPGYLLRVEDEALDATHFRGLTAAAGRLVASGQRARARALYEQALALWRGPPLADVVFESFARNEVARLEEERLTALGDRMDCELALGRHDQVLAELDALVGQHPLRERLRAQLMLALYRSGRQADALGAYQNARRTLIDELGLEPGAELQELQQAVLRQDPALTAPTPVQERRMHSNLPAQPTSFLGRERELAEVLALLARAEVRLLTLTGAGGSGKTRLALKAAGKVEADYTDGVCWVPLAALRDHALVLDSVSQALGTKLEPAVHLAEKRLLLLLDNFEHLSAAAPRLSELIAACPNLSLLVTSREPLHLAGEHEYLVPTLAEQEAVELFRERAHSVEPEQAVLAICRRLDGLPLALELAAARTKVLPAHKLLARLEHRLPVLTGGPRDAPERQRTLQATIAWSHDLLTPGEQTLFARLAVFAGGCTLEAAEMVCHSDLDTLQSLLDKNLVRREGDRFSMLDTIHEYAAARLALSGEEDVLRARHAEHFVALARRIEATRHKPEYLELIKQFDRETANTRAAFAWLLDADPAAAIELAIPYSGRSTAGGGVVERLHWLERAFAPRP